MSKAQELEEKLTTILTDPNYRGGVQYWIQKYQVLLLQMVEFVAATGHRVLLNAGGGSPIHDELSRDTCVHGFDHTTQEILSWLECVTPEARLRLALALSESLTAARKQAECSACGADCGEHEEDCKLLNLVPPPAVAWDKFPAYLIDHHEGDVITEEGLQFALAAMLADPKYKPTPTP